MAAEDGLSGWLWTQGALGVEILTEGAAGVSGAEFGTLLLRAYFPSSTSGEGPLASNAVLALSLGSGSEPWGARLRSLVERPDEDWLARFRAEVQPFEVGERFLLDPREIDSAAVDPGDRILLRVPARTAFGTGTHASTSLVLRLLEREVLAGRTILDVGTGTGLLAFAALALGAASAVAFDIDPASPFAARANRELNRISNLRLFAGTFDALSADLRVQLALNNVVPEETRPYLMRLAATVVPGGIALFSGVLAVEAEGWGTELATAGFREVERLADEEWVVLRCERVG